MPWSHKLKFINLYTSTYIGFKYKIIPCENIDKLQWTLFWEARQLELEGLKRLKVIHVVKLVTYIASHNLTAVIDNRHSIGLIPPV